MGFSLGAIAQTVTVCQNLQKRHNEHLDGSGFGQPRTRLGPRRVSPRRVRRALVIQSQQAAELKKFFETARAWLRAKPVALIALGIKAASDTLAAMRRLLLLGLPFICGLGCASATDEPPELVTGAGGDEGSSLDAAGGAAVSSGGAPFVPGSGGQLMAGVGGTLSTGGEATSAGDSSGGSDAAATGGATLGSGGGGNDTGCTHEGSISYQLNNAETWPSDARTLITEAIEGALYYYNCYADLTQSLTINYNPSVPTAEANVDGWVSFGDDRGYMQVATAMHEIAHTLGVGYFPWTELTQDGKWTGAHVVDIITTLPASERDPDQYSQRTYITADSQHFWPYGLNQASEHQSDWSLINHVRLVAAMQLDKQEYMDNQP